MARWVLVLLPLVVTTWLWIMVHPLLEQAGVINVSRSTWRVALQGTLVGLTLWVTLKYLLPPCFLHT